MGGLKEEFLVDDLNPEHSKYLIVIIFRLGLANRLRSLADWYQVAQLMDRVLIVSWQPSEECNCPLELLLDEIPHRMKILRVPLPAEDEGVELVEIAAKSSNISVTAIRSKDEHSMMWDTSQFGTFELSSKFLSLSTDVIVTSYDGILSPQNAPCHFYMTQHSSFLRSIVPIKEIRDSVNLILEQFFRGYIMVGVHLRAHDSHYDWEIVPPGSEGGHAKKFGEGATVDDFIAVLRKIENKFPYDDSIVRDGEKKKSWIRFYIASNSDQAKKILASHFPTAISINEVINRNSVEGIQSALIENLLLSEAALIVNTYGSSFAEEAAMRNLRPLVSIWNGNLLHHHTIHLPFCGHMQYIKLLSSLTQQYEYTEGTIDTRKINGGLVTLSGCDALDDWGLYEAICPLRG